MHKGEEEKFKKEDEIFLNHGRNQNGSGVGKVVKTNMPEQELKNERLKLI